MDPNKEKPQPNPQWVEAILPLALASSQRSGHLGTHFIIVATSRELMGPIEQQKSGERESDVLMGHIYGKDVSIKCR